MHIKTTKQVWGKWLSLIAAVASMLIIFYVRSVFLFWSFKTAERWLLGATLLAALAVVFAVVTLPRWQSIVALSVAVFAGYLIFFGPPLYAVP